MTAVKLKKLDHLLGYLLLGVCMLLAVVTDLKLSPTMSFPTSEIFRGSYTLMFLSMFLVAVIAMIFVDWLNENPDNPPIPETPKARNTLLQIVFLGSILALVYVVLI